MQGEVIPVTWRPWLFKGSALLQVHAVIWFLFVLVETRQGSWLYRSQFINDHANWVLLAWVSLFVAILCMVTTFSVFVFVLDRAYHIILYCAWFVTLVGTFITFLTLFVQLTIFPDLLRWLGNEPSGRLASHVEAWDMLLMQLVVLIIPSCFAISGLFYTMVMLRTEIFSRWLGWGSFLLWSSLLLGVVFLQQVDQLYLLFAAWVLCGYVPWLWGVGNAFGPGKRKISPYPDTEMT